MRRPSFWWNPFIAGSRSIFAETNIVFVPGPNTGIVVPQCATTPSFFAETWNSSWKILPTEPMPHPFCEKPWVVDVESENITNPTRFPKASKPLSWDWHIASLLFFFWSPEFLSPHSQATLVPRMAQRVCQSFSNALRQGNQNTAKNDETWSKLIQFLCTWDGVPNLNRNMISSIHVGFFAFFWGPLATNYDWCHIFLTPQSRGWWNSTWWVTENE